MITAMGPYIVCPVRDETVRNYKTIKHTILKFKLTGAEKLLSPSSEVDVCLRK